VLLHLQDLGLGMIPSVCVHNGTGLHVFSDAVQYDPVLPHVLVPHWHTFGLGWIPSMCVHNGTLLHMFLEASQYNPVLRVHNFVPHAHDAAFDTMRSV